MSYNIEITLLQVYRTVLKNFSHWDVICTIGLLNRKFHDSYLTGLDHWPNQSLSVVYRPEIHDLRIHVNRILLYSNMKDKTERVENHGLKDSLECTVTRLAPRLEHIAYSGHKINITSLISFLKYHSSSLTSFHLKECKILTKYRRGTEEEQAQVLLSCVNLKTLTRFSSDRFAIHDLSKLNSDGLTYLSLRYMKFQKPSETLATICQFRKLETLIFSGNHLDILPSAIEELSELKYLFLDSNLLRHTNEGIYSLKYLQFLRHLNMLAIDSIDEDLLTQQGDQLASKMPKLRHVTTLSINDHQKTSKEYIT
jgi:hypothetical protein